jgi:NADPH:quinone reductase-like Zn-dependent oxidoreductase
MGQANTAVAVAVEAADEVVYLGYTRGQLKAAFEKVQHPHNWKLALCGIIPVAELAVTEAAAVFFAGSPLMVVYEEPVSFGPGRNCLVKGKGYYEMIGA